MKFYHSFSKSDDEELHKISPKWICIICHDSIQVPTRLLCSHGTTNDQGPDSCRTLACIRCIWQYLELEKPPNYRKSAKCLICHKEIASGKEINHSCYRVVDDIFDIADDAVQPLKNAFRCRSCKKVCDGNQSLWRHFREECPYSTIQCQYPNCYKWGLRSFILGLHAEDHSIIQCQLCSKSFGKRQFKDHLLSEMNTWTKKLDECQRSIKWIEEKMTELN